MHPYWIVNQRVLSIGSSPVTTYEPIIRDYRVPLSPKEDPRSIASRRDRSLHHDRPAPINTVPANSEVSSHRQRDLDLVPPSNFTHLVLYSFSSVALFHP